MFGLIPFPRVLVLCEMQSVSSRIWTRVAVSISCEDNHYTTSTSKNKPSWFIKWQIPCRKTVVNWLIVQVGRVFANVIPKTLKMVLDTSLLNTQQYKVCIRGKVEQSRERSTPFPTPRCSSYWKGRLLLALDYGCQQLGYKKYHNHTTEWDKSTGVRTHFNIAVQKVSHYATGTPHKNYMVWEMRQ